MEDLSVLLSENALYAVIVVIVVSLVMYYRSSSEDSGPKLKRNLE